MTLDVRMPIISIIKEGTSMKIGRKIDYGNFHSLLLLFCMRIHAFSGILQSYTDGVHFPGKFRHSDPTFFRC